MLSFIQLEPDQDFIIKVVQQHLALALTCDVGCSRPFPIVTPPLQKAGKIGISLLNPNVKSFFKKTILIIKKFVLNTLELLKYFRSTIFLRFDVLILLLFVLQMNKMKLIMLYTFF